eukprot:scaffold1140_cov251-Pinguiococcus_pyrenoidosus.AAC.2
MVTRRDAVSFKGRYSWPWRFFSMPCGQNGALSAMGLMGGRPALLRSSGTFSAGAPESMLRCAAASSPPPPPPRLQATKSTAQRLSGGFGGRFKLAVPLCRGPRALERYGPLTTPGCAALRFHDARPRQAVASVALWRGVGASGAPESAAVPWESSGWAARSWQLASVAAERRPAEGRAAGVALRRCLGACGGQALATPGARGAFWRAKAGVAELELGELGFGRAPLFSCAESVRQPERSDATGWRGATLGEGLELWPGRPGKKSGNGHFRPITNSECATGPRVCTSGPIRSTFAS